MPKYTQPRFNHFSYPALQIEIPNTGPPPAIPMIHPYYHPAWVHPSYQQNFGIANLQKLNLQYRQSALQAPKTAAFSVPDRQQNSTKLKDFFIDSILDLKKTETAPVATDYRPSWDSYNVNPMHYCGYNTVPKMDMVEAGTVSSTIKAFGEDAEIARSSDSDVDSLFVSSPSSSSSNLEEFSSAFSFEDPTSPQREEQFSKPKRARTTFTADQMQILEARFNNQQYMVGEERIQLAKSLNLKESQVKIWFQNRRIKWRKQNLEKMSKKSLSGAKKMKRFYIDSSDTRSV